MKSVILGCVVFIFFVIEGVPCGFAQSSGTSSNAQQVFVFVQRASSHVKYSKPEVFHNVLDDLVGYLKKKKVAMATDQFGGRSHSEDEMPLATVESIARDTGAQYLLYALVERPVTKWIKVTLTCYDMRGQKLWQEEAASGGGLSGGHGLEVTLDRLHEKLDKRVGQAGLPIGAPTENAQQAAGPQ
jgi:hypothetical protein